MKSLLLKIMYAIMPAVLSTAAVANPLSFDNDEGNLDFNKPANWAGDVLPGPSNTARIGNGHKVTINTPVKTVPHSCHIGIPNGPGTLTVNKGGSITFSYYAALGWDHLGTLTINEGGSFTSKLLGIGAYVVDPGRGPGAVLNMNGGILNTGAIQATSDKAILNLAGGTITATDIRMPASNDDGVIINWDFSSGSSTKIIITGPDIHLQNSRINLNIRGLKNGTYTLIENKGNGVIDFTGEVNIKGVATGSGARLNKPDNVPGADLTLTVAPADLRPPHLR